MNEHNMKFLKNHIDILSFRDLSQSTVTTYSSYMTQFLEWSESELSGKAVPALSWEDIRSFLLYLKQIRKLNPRTINVHIAQPRDFYQ